MPRTLKFEEPFFAQEKLEQCLSAADYSKIVSGRTQLPLEDSIWNALTTALRLSLEQKIEDANK